LRSLDAKTSTRNHHSQKGNCEVNKKINLGTSTAVVASINDPCKESMYKHPSAKIGSTSSCPFHDAGLGSRSDSDSDSGLGLGSTSSKNILSGVWQARKLFVQEDCEVSDSHFCSAEQQSQIFELHCPNPRLSPNSSTSSQGLEQLTGGKIDRYSKMQHLLLTDTETASASASTSGSKSCPRRTRDTLSLHSNRHGWNGVGNTRHKKSAINAVAVAVADVEGTKCPTGRNSAGHAAAVASTDAGTRGKHGRPPIGTGRRKANDEARSILMDWIYSNKGTSARNCCKL
jgi:hypothetical protein